MSNDIHSTFDKEQLTFFDTQHPQYTVTEFVNIKHVSKWSDR